MRWRRLGLSPGQAGVLAGTTLAHAALGFIPLFGGPGYEAALALGLLLPAPIACVSALETRAALARAPAHTPLDRLGAAVRFALLVLVVQLGVLLVHGARVGFCDPSDGLWLFALGPGAGSVLAAAWGWVAATLAGSVTRGRALAFALALAGPLGGVLVSLWRFWSSPMVFAFDPFAGFFAGTLYDTVIDAVPRLVTYRAGSAGSLLAVVCVAAAAGRARGTASALRSAGEQWGTLALGLAGAALSAAVTLSGPVLGHYQTTASIRRALGQSTPSQRCDVVYSSGILPERAALLGRECDAHLAAHEAWFGTTLPDRVTVFAFASAAQKGALMGAARTYIAKPWRREVYVQSDNYPHPVLAHELAHVVAGTFGRGPLSVAGPWAGWVPDPGRIEGFAVAAAPPEDSDFTLREWTRALRELGLLPPLRSIFKLSFLGQNSSTGYTVAGAVVEWLHERHGAAALRAWYAGASIESAFGETLEQLEAAFTAELDRVPLPDRILELARARFDRPAIFGRRCPHVVDELLDSAGAAFQGFDVGGARAAYRESLELDPSNYGARLGLAACAERAGDDADALARYEQMASDPSLTRVQRSSVLERLGDRALLAQRDADAAAAYEQAAAGAFDEHRGRTIAVKRYALSDPEARAAISALLIGDVRLGSDPALAMAALGAWSVRAPELGLADYLIGRSLYSRERWRDAFLRLQQALERELPLSSVRREASRIFIFTACALGEHKVAERVMRDYLADPGLSSARKTGMQRFAESCRPSSAPP